MDAYARLMYRTFVPEKPPAPVPAMVFPLPRDAGGVVCQGLHPTAGLSGNWAIDFCADPNTQVLAPEGGVIQRLSGHDPSDDTWDTMGVYGWTVYVRTDQGYVYFITHLGWRPSFIVDQRVQAGEIVGKVGDQKFRPDHTHVGVTSPLGTEDAKSRISAVAAAPRVKPVA
jgi:murein DD-endopeptidase MepM/ murein hydrolase activator NlpD